MGSISTGIGLISGIDIANLVNQLIAIESRGKIRLQGRLAGLQQQQAALLDINTRLLNLKSASSGLRSNKVFDSALVTSSDPAVLTATATGSAQPGTFSFLVKQLVASSQQLSKGFTDTDTTPLGLTKLSFEIGNGLLATDTDLQELNAGTGAARGKITIADSTGTTPST